jgi:tripartite-type tricarboxylate transporter receptor subunit TctC
MRNSRRLFLSAAVAAGVLASAAPVMADEYPSRPIRVIVPYAPGGGADSFARLSAAELEKILNTKIVVENMGGANTAIGAQTVAKAKPDGYTLLFTTDSTSVANAVLYKNLTYNPDELVSVGTLNEVALGIVVNEGLPVKNFAELIEFTKKSKDKLSYGSYGIGSQAHMMGEAYNKLFGTDLVHVPYKGAAPAVVDVMGGQVLFTFPALITVRGNLQAGKIRMLAVTSSERLPSLPDVPTFKELGHEKMSVGAWYGFFAPKDTPNNVISKFNGALATLLKDKSFVEKLIERGAIPLQTTPAQMTALIQKDRKFIQQIVDMTGITVN